jgi:hypothetical protein
MNIFKKLKKLAGKGQPRINAEAPTRLVERAIIARRGYTATLSSQPLREREKGKSE